MAGTGELLDQNQFKCCICLNVLENPVTLPCGHNYCMDCIQEFWDKNDNGKCTCPQCRQMFIPRPVLGRNNMLDEVVKKFRRASLNADPPTLFNAGSGDRVDDTSHDAASAASRSTKKKAVDQRRRPDPYSELEEVFRKKFPNNYQTVKDVNIPEAPKPSPLRKETPGHTVELTGRSDFLKYACYLTLDTNTANEYLSLSEGEMVVKSEWKSQVYPDHPERFDHWPQVLCSQGLSRCCYWEVKWTGSNGVHIAVSYKGTSRKGKGYDCHLGYNDKSWALHCSPYYFYFRYNNNEIPVEIPVPGPSRIGVFLDHRAGTLSFYSVSRDTMTLLHRVQTTFTEPLYPGFHVCSLSSLKLCYLG